MKKRKMERPGMHPALGDEVRFRTGLTHWTGRIVEDRGPLGVGGRHLFGIRFPLDSTYEGEEQEHYTELSADEFEIVKRAA